jgi:hypothetical protein
MAKHQSPSVPLVIGVVFNPEHPDVARLLKNAGVDVARLIASGAGAVVEVTAADLGNASKPTRKKPRQNPLRASPLEHASVILGVFDEFDGALSISQVAKSAGISAPQAKRGLEALRDNGQVFMGGEYRFARYAISQEIANSAAKEGRPVQESVQLHKKIRPSKKIIAPEHGPNV